VINNAHATVGLSEAQTSDLLQLKDHYQFSVARNSSGPEAGIGHSMSGYLGLLAIGAACENQGYKRIAERSAKLRRDSIRAFEVCLRRRPSPDDLLQELSKVTTVPLFIAEAIRRDVERLTGQPVAAHETSALALRS
jgi:hypothetical protein